jgi:hypothetical protein
LQLLSLSDNKNILRGHLSFGEGRAASLGGHAIGYAEPTKRQDTFAFHKKWVTAIRTAFRKDSRLDLFSDFLR